MKKNCTSVRKSKKQNTPLYIIIWLMLVGINTKAITYTWNKAAGGLWTTNTNWTPNSPVGGPAAGSDIIFIKTSADITDVPTITLNSMTLNSGAIGSCWLESSASGNLITVSSSLTVANGYTLGIGISGARLDLQLSAIIISSNLSNLMFFIPFSTFHIYCLSVPSKSASSSNVRLFFSLKNFILCPMSCFVVYVKELCK